MTPIPVFWIEPTNKDSLSLRRYADGPCSLHQGQYSIHDKRINIGEGPSDFVSGDVHPHDDARWPTQCDCGYQFKDIDTWQLFAETIYVRPDTKEEMPLRDWPVGAMYDATWFSERRTYPDFNIGEDGRCLTVRIPSGSGSHDWHVDAKCSNCDKPNDRTHKCWVRHGQVTEMPSQVHVDKRGHTCNAGAGSIIVPGWHGFLDHGYLTTRRA